MISREIAVAFLALRSDSSSPVDVPHSKRPEISFEKLGSPKAENANVNLG
jgi:hypothetical protein